MNSAHLDYKVEQELGERFYRVNSDSDGNPRYVIHWTAFASYAEGYETALKRAKKLFFKVYKARAFGGGFVISSYNLESTASEIIHLKREVSMKAKPNLLAIGIFLWVAVTVVYLVVTNLF